MNQHIILFDGVCNLCNGFVQFIIKHDKKDIFRFCSLQSEKAQELLSNRGNIRLDFTTVVFLENENVFTESDAVLKIARSLGGFWSWSYVCFVIPKNVRNIIYRFIAKHRYRVFGRKDSCMIPTPELKNKFLSS